jgi:ribosomal protein S18 acetylase RimI-like enzyme
MPIEIVKTINASLLANMNRLLIWDEKHRNKMTIRRLTQRMKKWLSSDYQAFLFLNKDKVFGYCLFVKTKEYVYIRQFYIKRDSRRLGLGKKTIGLLRKTVWEKDKRLRLDVLVTNLRGISFWKSVGFKDYCLTMELNPK